MGTRCSSHRPGGSLGPFPAATRAARFARQALPQGIWRGGLSSLGARGDPDTASQGAGRWLNRWPARHPARYSSHASHALSTVRDHTGAFIPEPSKEQLAVAEVLLSGDNVKVDAVAGSGKTTTLLHIARQVQDKTILLLTYNARLRHDCKDKKESCGLSNLEVHTYHSMGYKFYSSLCKNDAGLKEVVRKDVKVKRSFAYDMVIIDEAQDMSGLYCEFLHKLLHDNCNEEALLAIVGDNRQCIYEFMGADERHLTLAHKGVFATQRKWQELSLRTSYRVTGNMAAFINDVALGFKR